MDAQPPSVPETEGGKAGRQGMGRVLEHRQRWQGEGMGPGLRLGSMDLGPRNQPHPQGLGKEHGPALPT